MKGEKEMNEEKIKELFDLCVRVSNKTTAHVSFEYTTKGDESVMRIYVFNDKFEIERHFILNQFYDFPSKVGSFESAKKCLLEILINGRCPLNEP